MKKLQWSGFILAAVMALGLFTGCAKTDPPSESDSVSSGLVVIDPDQDNSDLKLPESSDGNDASREDSQPSEVPSSDGSPTESTEMQGDTGYTEAKFKTAFDKNDIDKAYASESNDANTNVEMIDLVVKFSEIWQDEVKIADKKARQALKGDALSKYTNDQKQWEDSRESALNQMAQAIQEEIGGTGASLEIGAQTAEFYRTRVYNIYLAIYLNTGSLPKLTYNTAQG